MECHTPVTARVALGTHAKLRNGAQRPRCPAWLGRSEGEAGHRALAGGERRPWAQARLGPRGWASPCAPAPGLSPCLRQLWYCPGSRPPPVPCQRVGGWGLGTLGDELPAQCPEPGSGLSLLTGTQLTWEL